MRGGVGVAGGAVLGQWAPAAAAVHVDPARVQMAGIAAPAELHATAGDGGGDLRARGGEVRAALRRAEIAADGLGEGAVLLDHLHDVEKAVQRAGVDRDDGGRGEGGQRHQRGRPHLRGCAGWRSLVTSQPLFKIHVEGFHIRAELGLQSFFGLQPPKRALGGIPAHAKHLTKGLAFGQLVPHVPVSQMAGMGIFITVAAKEVSQTLEQVACLADIEGEVLHFKVNHIHAGLLRRCLAESKPDSRPLNLRRAGNQFNSSEAFLDVLEGHAWEDGTDILMGIKNRFP